jgi:hypothetical protein
MANDGHQTNESAANYLQAAGPVVPAPNSTFDPGKLVADVENLKGAVANLESIASDLSKGNFLQLIADVESLQSEIAAVKVLIGDLDKVQIGGSTVEQIFGTIAAWVEKSAGVKL